MEATHMQLNWSNSKNERFVLLDYLRGIAIILMCIYHYIYHLTYTFSLDSDILKAPLVVMIQLTAQILFITLAGFCTLLSHNNIKRGLTCLGYGVVITLISLIFFPSQKIIFGILHFLGISILLHTLLTKHHLSHKSEPTYQHIYIKLIISILLFIVSYYLIYTNTLRYLLLQIDFIQPLYDLGLFNLLGIPNAYFYSADYFPLFPWYFLFLVGTYLGQAFKSKPFVCKLNIRFPLLEKLGHHSMFIYIVHTPLIVFSLYVLTIII